MLFGNISDGVMVLNPAGEIVKEAWLWLAEQYPYVVLGEFCIMPNHFHGILVIDGVGAVRATAVGAVREPPLHQNEPPQPIKPLGRLIGAFKTVSTKQINLLRNTPGDIVWQRNYYEHIVRSEGDMRRIAAYIQQNPMNWKIDRENPR